MANLDFEGIYELEPDIPLLTGDELSYIARVFPDLLFVEYHQSKKQMSEHGNAGALLARALESKPRVNATSGEVFHSVPQWAKTFSSVDAHERDHVRRIVSTTYGILCHVLRTQQLQATRKKMVEQFATNGFLSYPLFTSTPVRHDDAGITACQWQQAIESHISIEDLKHVERAIAGWMAEGSEFRHEELPGGVNRSTLLVENGASKKWLTSLHLLEFLGAIEEGNRLLGTGSNVTAIAEKLSTSWYNLPSLVWFSSFPRDPNQPNRPIRSPRENEITLSMSRNFPLDLLAAIDLSLWIPFTPNGFVSESGELSWLDICPAFRFARLVLACKKIGSTREPWPECDLNVHVAERQREMCEYLGWQTPRQLAADWLKHFNDKETRWLYDPKVGGFRNAATVQLLQLRCDSPGNVAINNIDYQKQGVIRNAGWITTESDKTLQPHCLVPEQDREATLLFFSLFGLFPALLGTKRDRRAFLAKFPKEMLEYMIDRFDEWGRGEDGWPSEPFRESTRLFFESTQP